MSNLWANPAWIDGSLSTAKPCSLPSFSSPIPTTGERYMFTQEWSQLLANWAPGTYGDAYPLSGDPDLTAFKLIAEGPTEDKGGGLVKWTRTYAKAPASYDDWEPYVYNFIGTSPIGPLAPANIGRFRFQERVTSRVQNDFFLLGVAVTDPITGGTYTPTTPGDIAQIFAIVYAIQFTDTGVDYGGVACRQEFVSDAFVSTTSGPLYLTTPSQTDYFDMVADAATNGWNAGKSIQVYTGTDPVKVDTSSLNTAGHTYYKGQIIAENSILTRWQNTGNLWLRRTRYVLAQ